MSRVVVDTSVLIGGGHAGEMTRAMSAASLAELHFGALIAPDPKERADRLQRLAAIESALDPVPIDAPIAREWGSLMAAVAQRGGRPRRRIMDLAIAATANVLEVPLVTADVADLRIIEDLVRIEPA